MMLKCTVSVITVMHYNKISKSTVCCFTFEYIVYVYTETKIKLILTDKYEILQAKWKIMSKFQYDVFLNNYEILNFLNK